MRKIIVSAGYMGSGSSAITDLISEFKDINNKHKDFEYIFLHCPNGVFDLEDKLLIGNNSIRSDEAIHSFKKAMEDLYDKKFWWPGNYKNIIGKKFKEYVDSYVDSITDIKTDNYWYYQENPTKRMQIQNICNIIIKKITNNFIHLKKPLRYKTMYLSYIKKEDFYTKSQKFINNILNSIDDKNDLLLDQLLLPHNAYRIEKYFNDNLKMIIVDRDPRDVFILNKYVWAKKNIEVPYSFDVEKFCEQFENIRTMEKLTKSENILRIKFEDLIYNYEKTLVKVMKFLDYKENQHIRKYERFNPEKSINNTQLFTANKEYEKEIEYIEKNLSKYLYNFPIKYESKIENTIE